MIDCREYNVAMRLELARKEIKDDPNRVAELAAYFTHAKLQPVHQALSLRSAMFIFFKLKNFATTATFCRRLLELNPSAKVKILHYCTTYTILRDAQISGVISGLASVIPLVEYLFYCCQESHCLASDWHWSASLWHRVLSRKLTSFKQYLTGFTGHAQRAHICQKLSSIMPDFRGQGNFIKFPVPFSA